MIEVFAGQEMETRVVPVPLDHGIGPELVAVPRRKNEIARKPLQKLAQLCLIGFRPRVEIIDVAASVWRIGVNEVTRTGGRECLPKICRPKRPVAGRDNFGDPPDLIYDLCDVRLRES